MNINKIKNDFPELNISMSGKPFCYLDNAATTLKPITVIDRMQNFYLKEYATIHRGIYPLSQEATDLFDNARKIVTDFINAKSNNEIIFTRGTTEAINLVATCYSQLIEPGSEIIISEIEHHANLVPWQEAAKRHSLTLKFAKTNDDGSLDLPYFENLFTNRTKLVAITHVSNVLGIVNPIKQIAEITHKNNAVILVDGAQAIAHLPVNVQDLNCDFYCFSGHKIYGPTGIGVLYAKSDLLKQMPPYQFGGDMIEKVELKKSTYKDAPEKFEAGTPAIAEAIGLGVAINYLKDLGMENINNYEHELLQFSLNEFSKLPDIKIFGTNKEKSGIISFNLGEIHPHDVGTILAEAGIAVRVGHHCSYPTMKRYKVPAMVRASLGIYNKKEDILNLIDNLEKVRVIFKK